MTQVNTEIKPFEGAYRTNAYLADPQQKLQRKLTDSIEDVIKKSGLKDGMTISFHHAFRGGDKVINQVMDVIAKMGFKDLTVASSSLTSCHAPLVEHIKNGVVSQLYTSGIRGELAEFISHGGMEKPVQIHSHGGRVHLIQSGELNIDVAFLGAPSCDEYGNANGSHGKSRCGSLGYAMADAAYAKYVIVLTEEVVAFPCTPASIKQDQVDAVVQIDEIGDPAKIGGGATRLTKNPRELLIARNTANAIEHSGFFNDGFSIQTGSGGASLAVTRFIEDKMRAKGITASFGLGGITSTMVDLHEKGLIKTLFDVQSFDSVAADSIARNPNHVEITANQYANPSSKGAMVDRLDVVILSALEIDTKFNVNVITGSDGVIRGASGGHSDTAEAANLSIIVAPLIRGRLPTVVNKVTNVVTPGETIDLLVTDHGIAVNPDKPELKAKLEAANLDVKTIEELQQMAESLTGVPAPIKYEDKVVAQVRFRDGSLLDNIYQVK